MAGEHRTAGGPEKDRLRQEIERATGGRLDAALVSKALEKLEEGREYIIRSTGDAREFASWIVLNTVESKKAGREHRRSVDKGSCILNGDMEFGRFSHYDYEDSGIKMLNEEERIANFNMTEVVASLIETHSCSEDAAGCRESFRRCLYIYIPEGRAVRQGGS